MRNVDTDVLVVGGGPAGLAAAIAARWQGLHVTVADCASPPIDKACGEGLMPDSLEVFKRLGVGLCPTDGAAFVGIKFVGPECSVAATFPKGRGLGIRRTELHQVLVEHGAMLGVEMLWRTRVSLGENGAVAINGVPFRSRFVIGADGQNSRVREWAGLSHGKTQARRLALRRHFRVRPWSDYVEIHWANESQAYVTPVGTNQICLALISRERFISFEDGLSSFKELVERLAGAEPASEVRGALSISRRLRRVWRENVALIGDASGSVDAITGEGLALAFRQALELGPALAAGNLSAYGNQHPKIRSLPEFMARSMLLLDTSAVIRRRTLCALSRRPSLFARMLAVHVGELELKDFGGRELVSLGWQMLGA